MIIWERDLSLCLSVNTQLSYEDTNYLERLLLRTVLITWRHLGDVCGDQFNIYCPYVSRGKYPVSC